MRPTPRFAAVLAAVLLAAAPARGLETDQFTVPPRPLVDISPQFQQHATAVLREVVAKANARALEHAKAAREASTAARRADHAAKAAACLADDFIAAALYDAVGRGLPECELEAWVARSHFPDGPAKFDPSMGESVYGANPFLRPLTMQELSPTVNLFGVYLGIDKIGHFFQQGYEYYEAYRAAEASGADRDACLRRAVEVGVGQENGFFGLMMVGVYSNADLAANYAGLKLYLNLTRPLHVNSRLRPALLVRRAGLWEVNSAAGADWLRPFFTAHLNESVNPCRYSSQLQATVRRNFPERAEKWVATYASTRAGEAARLRQLSTWYGEDYGHGGWDGVVTMLELYYDRPVLARR